MPISAQNFPPFSIQYFPLLTPAEHGLAVLEAAGLVAHFQDVAVMRDPVKQGGRHLALPNTCNPAEWQVGCNDRRRPLLELAGQMKQQRTIRRGAVA